MAHILHVLLLALYGTVVLAAAQSGRSKSPLLNSVGDEIGSISTLCSSSGLGSTNLFTTSFAQDSSTVGFNMACHWNITLLGGISNDCTNPCCDWDVFPPKMYNCRCCNSLAASESANTCVSTGCGATARHGGECTSCVSTIWCPLLRPSSQAGLVRL